MSDVRQELYLIADEIRSMATVGKHFAGNVYEVERAERMMELAARVAALAEGRSHQDVHAEFATEPWLRASPAIGVDAAVFDPEGRILLVQRKDNSRWAMPGGLAEIGQTPVEAALRELGEEAGLRGRAARLLAVFDGRFWGSRSRVHLLNVVFLVECAELAPTPGVEMLDARFYHPEQLPESLHHGHGSRIAACVQLVRSGETYFDPSESYGTAMPMSQRPSGERSIETDTQ